MRLVSSQESAGASDQDIDSAVKPARAANASSAVPPYSGAAVRRGAAATRGGADRRAAER